MFWNFFKKTKIVINPIDTPKAGEKWLVSFDESPWPSTQYHPVTILDAKEGWVRYAFKSVFTDERMKLKTFLKIYSRME